MKQYVLAIAATTALSACSGGNPFANGAGGGDIPTSNIPAELASDLDGVSYNPATQTLVVQGESLDIPSGTQYVRKAALDVPGYEAYTAQDSSLGRHATAYVQERDGTRAAIVVTGGQFGEYFRGGSYGRTGGFSKPRVGPNQVIEYAGRYVGMRNTAGDGGDLLPVAGGTDPQVLSSQAAEVVGDAIVRADFDDNVVDGLVYNRVSVDSAEVLDPLELRAATIEDDGQFTGVVAQGTSNRGTYGGIFGGTESSAVAGTLFAEEHIPGGNQEEQGLFVLARCGTPNADPICTQPNP